VEDALLDALVEDRDGRTVDLGKGLLIAGGEGLAHEAQGTAKLGLVGAIDGRLGDGLTGALEGRYVICHDARLFSFSPGWLASRKLMGFVEAATRENGMQTGSWCLPKTARSAATPLPP
jgi:hypothetical protein